MWLIDWIGVFIVFFRQLAFFQQHNQKQKMFEKTNKKIINKGRRNPGKASLPLKVQKKKWASRIVRSTLRSGGWWADEWAKTQSRVSKNLTEVKCSWGRKVKFGQYLAVSKHSFQRHAVKYTSWLRPSRKRQMPLKDQGQARASSRRCQAWWLFFSSFFFFCGCGCIALCCFVLFCVVLLFLFSFSFFSLFFFSVLNCVELCCTCVVLCCFVLFCCSSILLLFFFFFFFFSFSFSFWCVCVCLFGALWYLLLLQLWLLSFVIPKKNLMNLCFFQEVLKGRRNLRSLICVFAGLSNEVGPSKKLFVIKYFHKFRA